MSVVLYVVKERRSGLVCHTSLRKPTWKDFPPTFYTIEPVEYIPASVARGLVEALKEARTRLPQASSLPNGETEIGRIVALVDAALAAAEEELK